MTHSLGELVAAQSLCQTRYETAVTDRVSALRHRHHQGPSHGLRRPKPLVSIFTHLYKTKKHLKQNIKLKQTPSIRVQDFGVSLGVGFPKLPGLDAPLARNILTRR